MVLVCKIIMEIRADAMKKTLASALNIRIINIKDKRVRKTSRETSKRKSQLLQ